MLGIPKRSKPMTTKTLTPAQMTKVAKQAALAEAKQRRAAGEDVKVLEHRYTNPRTGFTDIRYTIEKR